MSILLSDTSFAESQVHWTYSGLYQQAYGPDLMAASSSPSSDNAPPLHWQCSPNNFVVISLYACMHVVIPQLLNYKLFTVKNYNYFTVACLLVASLYTWGDVRILICGPLLLLCHWQWTVLFFFLFLLTVARTIALTIVTVCLYNMFFFSGLLRWTVACK